MKPTLAALVITALLACATSAARAQDFPHLTVSEPELGTWEFDAGSAPIMLNLAPSVPLDFSWIGDASAYAGSIDAYRYGWDVSNPEDDNQWDTDWCVGCLAAPTRTFGSGSHHLRIQVRDTAGAITEASILVSTFFVAIESHDWGVVKRLYRD